MLSTFRRQRHDRLRVVQRTIQEAYAGSDAKGGPPAVVLARALFASRTDIRFDPLETLFVIDGEGLRVRAWVYIEPARIPPAVRSRIDLTERALGEAAALRRIFFLSAAYGLPTDAIAALMGLGRRKTRRLLLTAIARLDPERSRVGQGPAPDAG